MAGLLGTEVQFASMYSVGPQEMMCIPVQRTGKASWRRESKPREGRIDMGGHGTAAKAAPLIDVHGLGKLSIAPNTKAPLLVVFGGIDVGGVRSGVYMWKYMSTIEDRFHVFVATSSDVNGTEAYNALMKTFHDNGLTPSRQILYLFSGGYKPGISVLSGGVLKDPKPTKAQLFSSIYLVDIWMGLGKHHDPTVANFYKALADSNPGQLTYVYTSFGANNEDARDYIAKKVGARATFVKGSGMEVHMGTNATAVKTLQ
jgi:hypothetical protein